MTAPRKDATRIILILGALCAITPFAIDLYLPAFPQIAAGLGSTEALVSLSLSSYFIGMAFGQLFYGPLLDRFGRKYPLYAGLLIFVAASVGCALATDVETLIAMRVLQALGGCVAQVAAVAMVRDFFPLHEGAKVLSLLLLILSVSPLLAPSIGSLITVWVGWRWLFVMLGVIALGGMAAVIFRLPDGQPPDTAVSLRPLPILRTFRDIFLEPQFRIYALSGAFCFSGLFLYVAGSPIIFMKVFGVSTHTYGLIFAGLSVGFIGGSQINIFLSKYVGSATVFRFTLVAQAVVVVIFLIGVWQGWYGLGATIALLFAWLLCLGLLHPNATVLALAPFTRNVGSASALHGFLQIGAGALSSALIGLLNAQTMLPIVAILAGATLVGTGLYFLGRKRMTNPIEPAPPD